MFKKSLMIVALAALAVLCSHGNTLAQPDTAWIRWYGGTSDEEAYSVQQTTDGGFIIAGCTESSGAGGKDVWLIKTDAQGDTLWTKTYGGTSDDGAQSVQRTTDGGYIITGWTYSFGPGSSDIWLIKTDAQGDTLWTRTYGGTGEEWGSSAKQTADGGFIIAASTKSFAVAYWDFYLIRTNAVGDTLWTRTWDNDLNDDRGCSALETTDGGFVICGYFWYDNGYNMGAWLIKTDSNGNTLWSRTYGGAYWTRGHSVQQTSDDGFIIPGLVRFSYGAPSDVYLVKTDSLGNDLPSKNYGGAQNDVGHSVQQTADGGYMIAGSTQSFGAGGFDVWLLKTDANGDTTWTMTYGGTSDDHGISVEETADAGYIITGYTESFGAGGKDVFLIKLAYPVPEILSTSPAQNELNVSLSTDISVTFDLHMDETTINDSTFLVNARSTGLHPGTITYDGPSRTATLDPVGDFDEGEVVTVTLTTGIESSGGAALDSAFVWSFTLVVNGGSGIFVPDSVYPVGHSPHSVFAADLDGDGDLDLAVANGNTDNVSVLLNNGDGTFALHSVYPVGDQPHSVFAADFDADGDLDLATANITSDNVSVLLNNGDGTFAPHSVYPVGDVPVSVFSADLDGDGDLDLATANLYSSNVSVLLNDGDGTFAPDSVYPVGGGPRSVFSADLDGDGDLDLATANGVNNVSVLLNNGDGTFAPHSAYPVGEFPSSVFSADLDGDGDLDLAVANDWSDNVSVLLNNGYGTFAPHSVYAVGDYPQSVFCADLDGDGDLDLTTANFYSDNVSVLLNNGDGTCAPHSVYPVGDGPYSVFSADLDGDGDLDLATANRNSNNVSVLLNASRGDANGDGIINVGDIVYLVSYLYKNGPAPSPVEVGDCNCDGIVNVGDIVYLVSYLYKNGPPPGCP